MIHMRIDSKTPRRQATTLDGLYSSILIKDPYWHYFRDEDGITLRISDTSLSLVEKHLDAAQVSYFDIQPYTEAMEYKGTRESFNDLIQLFHLISDLSCRYRSSTMVDTFLERAAHQIANHGYMNHSDEAKMLSGLALNRARVAGWAEELQ